jgi:hypothetical protein
VVNAPRTGASAAARGYEGDFGGAPVALEPIPPQGAEAFRWLRASEEPLEFTLLLGDHEVARLRWRRRGGSFATAETASARWTLKREGFLSPRLSVRAEGSTAPLARLTPHLRHHLLELPGGRTFRFHRESLLLPAWTLSRIGGPEVLHIEPVPEGRRLAGGAAVAKAPYDPAELALLLVFTWYFIGQAWFEDEAVEALTPLEGPDAPRSFRDR